MAWPSPQDYNEAVQAPSVCFADDELKQGALALDKLGLPRPVSGAFASVYEVRCGSKSWAVRCFLRGADDQEKRYIATGEFLGSHDPGVTVPFSYLDQGVRVQGQWFPVLKMKWVHGRTLEHVVEEYLGDSEAMGTLAKLFQALCGRLQATGIAHGDLQHGNIMVTADGTIRLVDYDGMYVPPLAGLVSNEVGHGNYQHPARSSRHFGSYLDNFSAWLIYTCLHALSVDPSCWQELEGGDDCLLFRKADLMRPLASPAFALLERAADEHTALLAKTLRYFLSLPVEQVPPLGAPVQIPYDLPSTPSLEAVREQLSREESRRQAQRQAKQAEQHALRLQTLGNRQPNPRLRAPDGHPVAAPPAPARTTPILIAEALGERQDADALPSGQSQYQPTGTTALDLLLADRALEDKRDAPGAIENSYAAVVVWFAALMLAFVAFVIQIIASHAR